MKKETRTNRYGIWIDHRQAVVVRIDADDRLQHVTMKSGFTAHPRFPGEKTDKTGLFGHSIDRQARDQRRAEREFGAFLKEVVRSLEKVNAVLVMGPGDARHGLENEIRSRKSLAAAWLENRACDKMTIPQLRAAVAEHFNVVRT